MSVFDIKGHKLIRDDDGDYYLADGDRIVVDYDGEVFGDPRREGDLAHLELATSDVLVVSIPEYEADGLVVKLLTITGGDPTPCRRENGEYINAQPWTSWAEAVWLKYGGSPA